jgi:hypothetical protein
MMIISNNGIADSKKDIIVLSFEDENDLSNFINKLISIPVKTAGIRVTTLIPEGKILNDVQSKMLDLIDTFDGIGGKDTYKILDNVETKLKDIINYGV